MPFTLLAMPSIEFLIKEYVDDHFNNFGFYPYDVEVDNKIYSFNEYTKILSNYKKETN